ncbi:MAG: PEP-CTERM sorting domain-containing protein [Phycisphaerales bacterium]|nr:PEP-CTERM sorting domain-containing protein [Phycisphaerales bacterium]
MYFGQHRLTLMAAVCLCCITLWPERAAAQSFEVIGAPEEMPFPFLYFQGVSKDGLVCFGQYINHDFQDEAVSWTSSGGLQAHGSWAGDPGGPTSFSASNRDGSVLVGSYRAAHIGWARPLRWTPSAGIVDLGILPAGQVQGVAQGVDASGAVIVGTTYGTNTGELAKAFRWTAATGMVNLGFLSGGSTSSASGVSADGLVIVGSSASSGGRMPIRWTAANGMQALGPLPPGYVSGHARATNGDGSVIVGSLSKSDGSYEPFVWTAALGFEVLGNMGGQYGTATDISENGVVVGTTTRPSNYHETFLWTASSGMRSIPELLLTDYGIDISNQVYYLGTPSISADGAVIAGEAERFHEEFGQVFVGWIIRLPAGCPSDFDGSGFVDIEDYTAFVLAFEAGIDEADFDESGFVDIEDFTSFVLAFEAGC